MPGSAGRAVAWLHCQWCLAACGSAMHLGLDLMSVDRIRDGVEWISAWLHDRQHGGGALRRAQAA